MPHLRHENALLQKLDLYPKSSVASKIQKQLKALSLLLLLLASQSSQRAHLRKIGDFASCGQGDPDTPTAQQVGRLLVKGEPMAIYHCSIQPISRSDGRSIVACAAYRAGEKLECDTYGKTQDYTRKTGIEYTQIFAPDGANPDLLNRQKLWNQVEQSELKKTEVSSRRHD
jgi:hypothetical protein